MSKIPLTTFKVLNVNFPDHISKELSEHLRDHVTPTYRDVILKEDLFDIDSLMDSDEYEDVPEGLREELTKLNTLCNTKKISYIRIVYNP